ncbi:helix-turn-helix transcriptional regulator [Candidatus Poribacteria bacterium]|nr:helix-turn-helix transcriptional regulator [Candidatus Poribacteria bacterium]
MRSTASALLGRAIRLFRESSGLSQERLADLAGITYQYLSAVENGKENFTVGVLESIARALGITLDLLVEQAYTSSSPVPVVDKRNFVHGAALPPELRVEHIEAALNETQRVIRLINASLVRDSGRPLPAYIQRNSFSGIVSNVLTDAFSRLSPYKHNHDQKFPDLVCKNAQGVTVAGLEVKCTIQTGKGGESHNGHSGWHVVACFSVDDQFGDVRFIHVMLAELVGHGQPDPDWKYVRSTVNPDTGSQRTETYSTTPSGIAKLRHGTVYLDPALEIRRWRTPACVPAPPHSPFQPRRTHR